MCVFRCKCVFLGITCIFFVVILQNFAGGMPPDSPRMVILKLICDVTQLWRNLGPPRDISAYVTETNVAHGIDSCNRIRFDQSEYAELPITEMWRNISDFVYWCGGLLLALYSCNGLVAPRPCLYNFSFHFIGFVFVFWACSLHLICTPCAW